MKCNECTELLSPYIDHMLTEKERKELEMHLKTCPACAKALNHLQIMLESIGTLEEAEMPKNLHQDIMKSIQDEVNIKKKTIPYRKWITYLSGVAAVLLITVILFDSNQMKRQNAEADTAQAPKMMKEQITASSETADASENMPKNQEKDISILASNEQPKDKAAGVNSRIAATVVSVEEWEITSDEKDKIINSIKDYSEAHDIQLDYLPDEVNTVSIILHQISDKEALLLKLREMNCTVKTIHSQQGEDLKITFKQ